MKRRMLLLATVWLLPLGTGRASDDDPIKVPFETLKTQHIVVMVKLNGKGPYRLIFDTGAPVTLINFKTAKDAGVVAKDAKPTLPLLGDITPQKVKVFEIGHLRSENVSTIVLDHPTVAAIDKALGPVDGIVGLSFF